MSSYIIVSIIILLSGLACYAFISQAIEQKRIQKQRILMAIKTKRRNFVHMINGIPHNLLPVELLSLVYRALINTCEQLNRIEPNNIDHQDDIPLYSNQLRTLIKNNTNQSAQLEDPQQMKDVRQHMQELQYFVQQQETLKTISKTQAKIYLEQIKRLALKMVIDTYTYQANQAQQKGKDRLTIHYLTLAKKLLTAENATHGFDKKIAHLDATIVKLEENALSNDESTSTKEPASNQIAKEWESFNKKEQENVDWKKKQIYD